MHNLGYCCINMTLTKEGISTNRGMVQKTFLTKGIVYAAELALKNLQDLQTILEWNVKNAIFVYRMSSDIFPWFSEYELEQLHNVEIIQQQLQKIGRYVKHHNIRLTFHPSHFNVLGSENVNVVTKTVLELGKHSQIMDWMLLDASPYYAINFHLNSTKPDKVSAAKRFLTNYEKLPSSVTSRLTIENDDSEGKFSTLELYNLLHKELKIPILFDEHHFRCGLQDQSLEEALRTALSTWGEIKPLTHYSSSKKIEDLTARTSAHADYIYEKISTFGLDFDTEIEAKNKEMALLKYRIDYCS